MAKAKYEFFIRFEYEDAQMLEESHMLAPRGTNKTNHIRQLLRAGIRAMYPEVFSKITGIQLQGDIQGRGPDYNLDGQHETNIKLGMSPAELDAVQRELSPVSSPGLDPKKEITLDEILKIVGTKDDPHDKSI